MKALFKNLLLCFTLTILIGMNVIEAQAKSVELSQRLAEALEERDHYKQEVVALFDDHVALRKQINALKKKFEDSASLDMDEKTQRALRRLKTRIGHIKNLYTQQMGDYQKRIANLEASLAVKNEELSGWNGYGDGVFDDQNKGQDILDVSRRLAMTIDALKTIARDYSRRLAVLDEQYDMLARTAAVSRQELAGLKMDLIDKNETLKRRSADVENLEQKLLETQERLKLNQTIIQQKDQEIELLKEGSDSGL